MQRREAAQARETKRPVRSLRETDYLLGVHDEQRSGALRFKEPETGDDWMSSEPAMRTPPWTSLRELENASSIWRWKSLLSSDSIPTVRKPFCTRSGMPSAHGANTRTPLESHAPSRKPWPQPSKCEQLDAPKQELDLARKRQLLYLKSTPSTDENKSISKRSP